MKKCDQFKCIHNPDNDSILSGVKKELLCALCPICESCSAPQHKITNGCKNCLLCESKEGYIRRGQPKPFLEIGVKQKEDVEIVKQIIINQKQPETE